MKILHVTSGIDPRGGGTTTALAAMAEAQRDIGLDVTIISTFAADFESATADRLRADRIAVELIGPHGRFLAHHPDIARQLSTLIAAADIVHIHALWESIQHQAALISRRMNKPYLFTPHGMLDPWSLAQGRLKKRLYLALRLRRNLSLASAIHFTNAIERDLVSRLNIAAPTIVEPYILDLREFAAILPPGTFRATVPQLQQGPIVLFLGRLHKKKGLSLLMPAFAAMEGKDAMLVLAGPIDDEYRAELQKQIDELQIGSRVVFTGMLTGPQRVAAFADADVFVLPSYQENVGIAVIESLAAGTPVIISDRVNIHPEIARADVGEVIPPQIEPLAEALNRMLFAKHNMTDRCRNFVAQQYDRLAQARRWQEHYQRLIDSSRLRSHA
ncbi:MAG: glycosyltransferase [Phycisphaerae bacterium]|nr:glycosyltransferase [Phycisphaerae bacterium]